MFQFLFLMLNMIISFIFTQMKHPLAMGLILLIQTLLICLMTGLITKTFWFSYILFLVFLGGMLILFIYMTSLASNEMFTFSSNLMLFIMLMISMSTIILLILDQNIWIFNFMNLDMSTFTNMSFLNMNENSLNLTKLYNLPTSFITIMLINYLFLTLIVIVKITNIFYGPLRQKN
uniref:NADH dehydrogenase subunit 6 n=1 Tax=Dicerapanorpa magna TaxID=2492637 RepID=UPI002551E0D7|nr:NADH dehydrogenase subunit 6 [Dicerapanorpa magna]WGT92198.1 NADH dehydrogenase subunit 6 [Dicerapanorpa magna]WGT92210.1 NADH dehydrogenase subunit 6 [Dicerapanorpa magna]WGT92224.1 NADH dehydrogenase subunit 6 [Dicerapanorpa magna]WGT92237.1 NADH dehydrogenase subunit 6 [Dicerapanorpa magna]